MAGWDLKEGQCKNDNPSEQELWGALNYMLKKTHKTTTYKFCFLKCLLDYADGNSECKVSYSIIFKRFTEIYWDLIVKYGLIQAYSNSRFAKSKVEMLIENAYGEESEYGLLSMANLPGAKLARLLNNVERQCSSNVVGAFYDSTYGFFYGFKKNERVITFSSAALNFLKRYHDAVEEITCFNWAKMIEKINGDNTPKALVTKMSRLGLENAGIIVINAHDLTEVTTQKFNLEDILPWSFR